MSRCLTLLGHDTCRTCLQQLSNTTQPCHNVFFSLAQTPFQHILDASLKRISMSEESELTPILD